jgi:hypothetical protein
MGYQFAGFFCDGDDTVLRAARNRWPFCVGKAITTPFRGIGLRCPDPDEIGESDQGYDYWEERIFSVEEELLDFSTQFPELTFSFIRADCFGGACEYAGFVARDGVSLFRVEFDGLGVANLRRLLKPLGVRLLTGYFRPFVRGYWDDALRGAGE